MKNIKKILISIPEELYIKTKNDSDKNYRTVTATIIKSLNGYLNGTMYINTQEQKPTKKQELLDLEKSYISQIIDNTISTFGKEFKEKYYNYLLEDDDVESVLSNLDESEFNNLEDEFIKELKFLYENDCEEGNYPTIYPFVIWFNGIKDWEKVD